MRVAIVHIPEIASEQDAAQQLSDVARSAGWTVHVAESAHDAIAHLSAMAPAVAGPAGAGGMIDLDGVNGAEHYDAGQERELLQVTLSSIGDAVATTDNEGRITFMNGVAEAMSGWRLSEAAGRPVDEVLCIVDAESNSALANPAARVLERGAIVGVTEEATLVTRDGQRIPIEESASPIRDRDGVMRGIVMVMRDITERKRSELERQRLSDEISRQQIRLRNIISSVPGVVWEAWGLPDAESQRMNFVSDYVETMLGYTVEEWLDTPNFWLTIVHPDDQKEAARRAMETFSSGRMGTNRFRWVRRDGTSIWVEAQSIAVCDADGTPVGMRGVTLDITPRVHAENELRRHSERLETLIEERRRAQEEMMIARDEAEAANRAKDQFLAVLSHELRTPLTPVLAVTHVLENDDRITADQRPLIEMIRRNIELEARLIDDLLDLTRISKGKLSLAFETVDINRLIGSVVSMCRSDVAAKQLELSVDLQARDHFIRADSARMQQVLWNLIKNATKFTPEGGRIAVRAVNDRPGHVRIEVADTGIGIDPALLPRIFNAFDQGGSDITKRYGGIGLGLSISRSLVEMHGGTLSATSDGNGKGATFVVELDTVVRIRIDNGTSPSDGRRPIRVLIVDDHIETSKVMKLLLERRGYVVKAAHTLNEALDATRTADFDLLISDIGLPDGSGLDLMRALADRKICGIALSGFGMEEDIARSKEAGFAEHLIKPVSFQSLQETIGRVLS